MKIIDSKNDTIRCSIVDDDDEDLVVIGTVIVVVASEWMKV